MAIANTSLEYLYSGRDNRLPESGHEFDAEVAPSGLDHLQREFRGRWLFADSFTPHEVLNTSKGEKSWLKILLALRRISF